MRRSTTEPVPNTRGLGDPAPKSGSTLPEMSPRLEFAIDAAVSAGRSTLAHFQSGVEIEFKRDASPVTIADREAERRIRREIGQRYPGEAILGEEEGVTAGEGGRWVIDPIDGTKSFVCGVPLYATLLSFEQEGEPILGVCYFPALDELIYAERGCGATWNGRAAHVSQTAEVAGSVLASGSLGTLLATGRFDGFWMLGERAMTTRTWGDAYGHALVATGRVAAMLDPRVARWDISAIAVIVREAGGRFTDFAGNDGLANEAISSNGRVHDEILEAFRA